MTARTAERDSAMKRVDSERTGEPATTDREQAAGPVVVSLDGSANAEHALPWAIGLAKRRRAVLLLLRVASPYISPSVEVPSVAGAPLHDPLLTAELEDAVRYVEQMAAEIRAAVPDLPAQTAVHVGDPAAQILDTAATQHAQVVVLTTHGRTGLDRWVRGSVAEKVLRYGNTPLLLIRPWDVPAGAAHVSNASRTKRAGPEVLAGARLGDRVLVPLDGSSLAEHVLPEAVRLAANDAGGGEAGGGGELVLVTVTTIEQRSVPPGAGRAEDVTRSRDAARIYLHEVARRLRWYSANVRTVVLTATDATQAIVEQATTDGADVIAMCTHGRGGLGRLLYGSVADRVSHVARVPVLLFHPRPDTPAQGAAAPASNPAVLGQSPTLRSS